MKSPKLVIAQCFGMVLALSAAAAAHAQLYKWVDSSGHTQYSDNPPAGVKTEAVKSHISSVQSSGGGQPASIADQEQAFRKRQMQAQDLAKKQEADAQRAQEACSSARSRLAGLEASGRQVRFDANGERHYLDDNQMAQEKSQAQQEAAKFCK